MSLVKTVFFAQGKKDLRTIEITGQVLPLSKGQKILLEIPGQVNRWFEVEKEPNLTVTTTGSTATEKGDVVLSVLLQEINSPLKEIKLRKTK